MEKGEEKALGLVISSKVPAFLSTPPTPNSKSHHRIISPAGLELFSSAICFLQCSPPPKKNGSK